MVLSGFGDDVLAGFCVEGFEEGFVHLAGCEEPGGDVDAICVEDFFRGGDCGGAGSGGGGEEVFLLLLLCGHCLSAFCWCWWAFFGPGEVAVFPRALGGCGTEELCRYWRRWW